MLAAAAAAAAAVVVVVVKILINFHSEKINSKTRASELHVGGGGRGDS
jgi:hypothetical protein